MKPILSIFFTMLVLISYGQEIPLKEHPRPDFERPLWQNLNGEWQFEFDAQNIGVKENWNTTKSFTKKIKVPFPWGSELSGVKDEADIAWYKKNIRLSDHWNNKRVFIIIGASDWETEVWIDDHYLGKHQGGYMPFEFEITDYIKTNTDQTIAVRVDDARRNFTLYGKQGYGNARGIWQTIYLEARGVDFVKSIKCIPDIEKSQVKIKVSLPMAPQKAIAYEIEINGPSGTIKAKDTVAKTEIVHSTTLEIPNAKLWSLEDPNLYTIKIKMANDEVQSYFGMRKISVEKLPGTEIPYIALNNKPVYLQLALDQSYHPQGFYTFPSDAFMKREIELSKSIGLNGIRIHIKPEIPRKLYWADKLGLLVMADLPNSWGEPEPQMQNEAESTLRQMVDRDYNHPSIFSWIVFNETWGLTTKVKVNTKIENHYLPETQTWVASMYYLTKSLDPTRLVEDNSICCGRGHTETDIYSWHEYQPGWEWENLMKNITDNNYPGSTFHYEKGYTQGNQPNINSECGNVWGYEGSTGDVDWSYDYHRMMNTFRKYPKMAGWLYTEHHDVINEWNGYWRFDRSNKYLGLEKIVPGMTLNDLHSMYYVSTGNEITRTVSAGETIEVPLYVSVYEDKMPEGKYKVYTELWHTDQAAVSNKISNNEVVFDLKKWEQKILNPIKLKMAATNGLSTLRVYFVSPKGDTLHRNFCHFLINNGSAPTGIIIESVKPKEYVSTKWSIKQWNVMDGLKVNGAGKGFFEYSIPIKQTWKVSDIKDAYLVMEVSAKELFDKDKESGFNQNQNYMLGSRVSPSRNPNAYPMTDDVKHSSIMNVSIHNKMVKTVMLEDDPADHQGILSWHSQLKDKKLREAGSYGYLVKIPLTKSDLVKAKNQKYFNLKLESVDDGGLAIYGSDFGRYPIDINVVLNKK